MKGQTLVEVLVAMTVGVLVLTAITSSVLTSLVNSRATSASSVASQYAQEAMEIARISRAAPAGIYCLDQGVTRLAGTQNDCTVANVDGKFIRSVQVLGTDVKNDCGAGINKIIATVKWKDSKCPNGTYCHQTSMASCANVLAVAVTATITPTPSQSPTPTLSPTPTPIIVQVDSTSNSGAEKSANVNWRHTVNGQDRLLIVDVVTENSVTPLVTWNGTQTLTQITHTGSTGNDVVYMYYLVNPALGTADISVYASSAGNVKAGAISFAQVNQTTPLGTAQTLSLSSGASISSPVVVSNSSEKVVDAVAVGNNLTMTQGGSQQQVWKTQGGSLNPSGAGSYVVGSASTVMTWSFSSSSYRSAIIAVPVKPVQ